MWRLFYPLRYLWLINRAKWHIEAWSTLGLAAIIAAPYIFLPGISFFRAGGFLDKVIPLTSTLTGFYVTALVAAATFTHPDLDKVIRVGAIALVTKNDDGKKIQEHLTRRQFATTMFGYLAFAALAVSLAGAIFITVPGINWQELNRTPWVAHMLAAGNRQIIRGAIIFVFTAAISNIFMVTSLGLYYLMDRLHSVEPKVTAKKSQHNDRAA